MKRPPARTSAADRAIYRRRRMVVGVVVLVLIAGLAFAGTLGVRALMDRFGGAAGAEDPSPSPEEPTLSATTDAPPDEEALANPVACRAEAVELALALDSTSPAAGSDVTAAVTVTNRGQVPCLLDVGHEDLTLTVTSGEDQVWSSVQCPAGPGETPVLLDTGAQEEATLVWSGRRSAQDCPGDSAVAEAGTYVVEAALDVGETLVAQEQALTLR
ncbi:hypothetical protein LQF12_13605 [Ruania suaedae]|uniref:hypothetical protein n=1 Tax=Ruania suaedae TaxID=2897774 RepID=UPI001E63BDA1|nr:hypothetical protein [Ruania suaedae]UFU02516.1 hypothetical protein LQF12_13605 [Ruania suaedae]